MLVAQHADALRIEVASVEVPMLAAVGTIPGVAVLHAAGRNGPGQGRLKSHGETIGTLLYWRAPGSQTFGPPHRIEADGQYVLEDGEDPSKYVRIQVWTDHLCPGAREGSVHLRDLYNNAVGMVDKGTNDSGTLCILILNNDGLFTLTQVKAWLEPGTTKLYLIYGGSGAVQPTSEATALQLDNILPGQSPPYALMILRVYSAASPDPDVLSQVHLTFHGL